MNYIKEIDGIRGLAVLAVMMYHADVAWLPGGYIGVDVFFVISGFLITRVLLEQHKRDSFSIVRFYAHRIGRLIPALFMVLITSLLASWVFIPAQYWTPLADSSRYAALFLSNFYFLLSVDYFSPSASFQVLGHTWSLAVEEQFYLLYPWLILLVLNVFRVRLIWVLLGFTLFSFGLHVYLSYFQASVTLQNSAFYLLPARGWEIFLGAMLALSPYQRVFASSSETGGTTIAFVQRSLPTIGMLCVLIPLFWAHESQVFYLVMAVMGCFLLIVASGQRSVISQLLRSRILIFTGLISYCLYLWHQPVFSLYRFVSLNDSPDRSTSLLLMAFIFVLSVLTHRLVEGPMRQWLRNKLAYSYLMLALFVMSVWAVSWAMTQEAVQHEIDLAKQSVKSNAVYFDYADDRQFTIHWLNEISSSFETVVMGSSRLMSLGENSVTGPIINTSVRGASVEDLIAILPLAVLKANANKVFIGIDPWMLNQNVRQHRWKSIDAQFNRSMQAISNQIPLSVLSENTQASVPQKRIAYLRSSSGAISLEVEARNKRASNGQLIVSSGSQQPLSRFSEHQAKGAYDYAFNDFSVSGANAQKMVELSRYLSSNGLSVFWVMVPYHPVVSDFSSSQQNDLLTLVEQKVRSEAEENLVTVLGSFNSDLLGCAGHEFYDVAHPHSSCIEKALLVEAPD